MKNPLVAALMTASVATPALAQLTPPPGPPADTDRVREQADARIPITTFANITEPGSYYLTGDVASVVTPISIQVSGVTLDLNGYRIHSSPRAMNISPGVSNIRIRNGTIENITGQGIAAEDATQVVIEDIQFRNIGKGSVLLPASDPAIHVGANSRVERVSVFDAGEGILFNGRGSIARDITIDTVAGDGVRSIFFAATLEDSMIRNAGEDAVQFVGDSAVRRVTARTSGNNGIVVQRNSLVESCQSYGAADTGITALGDSVIRDSVAANAGSIGIEMHEGGQVVGCTVSDSGRGIVLVSSVASNVDNGAVIRDSVVRGATGIGVQLTSDTGIYDSEVSDTGSRAILGADNNVIESVRVWNASNDGIEVGADARIIGTSVSFVGASGIQTGDRGLVAGCAVDNAFSLGIRVGDQSTVRDSVITESRGSTGDGISTGADAKITNCTVDDMSRWGIDASRGASISDCEVSSTANNGIRVSSNSTIDRCVVRNCGNTAIITGDYASVTNSRISLCDGNGIQVFEGSLIRGNHISQMGVYGVSIQDKCAVEENTIVGDLSFPAGRTPAVFVGGERSSFRVTANNFYNAGTTQEIGTGFSYIQGDVSGVFFIPPVNDPGNALSNVVD